MTLPEEDRRLFKQYAQTAVQRQADKKKKLPHSLNQIESQAEFQREPERYAHNCSAIMLSHTTLEELSLDLKFCYPWSNCDRPDTEIQVENFHTQLNELASSSEFNAERYESTVVNTCYTYLNGKLTKCSLLKHEHLDTARELKSNRNILLMKPDRTDYLIKISSIFSDKSKFRETEKDKEEMTTIEKSFFDLLNQMKQVDVIDSSTFELIRPTETVIPHWYDLPKVHEDKTPIKPILDVHSSLYHDLAR
ncbi:uncharacterized protein DEA37_0008516 [Paragonimus westermani]|uniref:Uncharacterized protein n=1 Tax=Paragonimus westermani TaxID=34504 RepID=A0A5J4NKH3_9TREM|nr:uncharacterized protein DEA37_0008516 [Paragonimus westermani]